VTDRFPFESVSAGAGAGREKTRRERKPARETGPAGPPAQEPRRWRWDLGGRVATSSMFGRPYRIVDYLLLAGLM